MREHSSFLDFILNYSKISSYGCLMQLKNIKTEFEKKTLDPHLTSTNPAFDFKCTFYLYSFNFYVRPFRKYWLDYIFFSLCDTTVLLNDFSSQLYQSVLVFTGHAEVAHSFASRIKQRAREASAKIKIIYQKCFNRDTHLIKLIFTSVCICAVQTKIIKVYVTIIPMSRR